MGDCGMAALAEGDCSGLPIMVVPMERRSSGESHTISFGGVTTICPMMPGGTPSSLTTRAMIMVAARD